MGWLKNFLDGGASEAQKKNEKVAAELKAMMEEQYGFGIAKLLEGLSGIDTSYQLQQDALSTQGKLATQAILENQYAALADANQNLIDSGLSGSTLSGNMASQIQKNTSMSLAGLAEQLAAQQIGVEQAYSANKFGALSNIANYAMNKVSVAKGVAPQYQAAGGGLLGAVSQGIGSAIGDGLGNLFGGGKKDDESSGSSGSSGFGGGGVF